MLVTTEASRLREWLHGQLYLTLIKKYRALKFK